jgi:ribonuclease-3
MESDPAVIEGILCHEFRDRELLRRALTHKSRAFELAAARDDTLADNEQLEFLGDSVLGFLVSEALLRAHPDFSEGKLSKLKSHLVSAAYLHQAAQRLNLGQHLLLGHGEEMSGGRLKKNLLSNTMEALIAAVYLDGGLEAARAFVERHVLSGLAELEATPEAEGHDCKSALQELAQTMGLPQPRYHIVREHGPEHSKTFTVEVRVGKEWAGEADGASKKSAGQNAAQRVLEQLLARTHLTNTAEE